MTEWYSLALYLYFINMNATIEQSYFGRNNMKPHSTTYLKAYFRRNAPQIIEFCNKCAKKFKRRNEYQSLLFPQDYTDEQSNDISSDLKEYYRKEVDYPFYLSRCNLFIDNYHLKLMRKKDSIPIIFDSLNYGRLVGFSEWVGESPTDYLIGVTDQDWVIIVSVFDQKFSKYRIQNLKDGSNKKIVSVNGHENFLFVFSKDEYHIIQYKNPQNPSQKLKFILSHKLSEKDVRKGSGFKVKEKYYVFFICEKYAFIQKPSQMFFQLDFNRVSFHQDEKDRCLDNFQINMKESLVTCAFASQKDVVIKTFNIQSEKIKYICKKENPYTSWLKRKLKYMPFLTFIQRQSYLLCCIAFRYQLFFIKIEKNNVQCSKRVKFHFPVETVYPIGSEDGVVVVLSQKIDNTKRRVVMLTHENKIVSFGVPVNLEAMEKFSFQLVIPDSLSQATHLSMHPEASVYNNRQIFFLEKGSLQRVSLSAWEDIYEDMKHTENIKLLKFLLLLNLTFSPFLQKPKSFEGLESFFPANSIHSKQILLEYYALMNLKPQMIKIEDIKVFLPFILKHKISNLSLDQKEDLMGICLSKDERLVEEMIIGGADCGWQYAIKNGWIRAFKVMVEGGMEIQMPILKLYSLALHNKKQSFSKIKSVVLNEKGIKYLSLMIEYIIFVLKVYFKDLMQSEERDQFKIIFQIIFRDDLWTFMMRHLPKQSVRIINDLFLHGQIINQINTYDQTDLSIFNYKFEHLLTNEKPQNFQIVFSHLSQTYLNANSANLEILIKEHSKIILMKFYEFKHSRRFMQENQEQMVKIFQYFNHPEIKKKVLLDEIAKYKKVSKSKFLFNFSKEYLKLILMNVIKNQCRLFKQGCKQINEVKFMGKRRDFQIFEETNDFFVYMWLDIFISIIEEAIRRSQQDQFYLKIRQEVRLLVSDIQQENYKEHFLILHLMMSINSSNEYTVKIFHRYLKCENCLQKEKIFLFLRKQLPGSSPLQEEFIKNLKEIIEIDKEECRDVLQTFFGGREREIIKKIDDDPALQLEYVQLIIKEGVGPIQNYYTNLHVELLLRLKPEHLILILKKNSQFVEYDISETLKIVAQRKDFKEKNDILIYLYETEGDISKCIETYLAAMEKLIMKYIEITEQILGDLSDHDMSVIKQNSVLNSWLSGSCCLPNRTQVIDELMIRFEELNSLIYRQFQVKHQYHEICLQKLSQLLLGVSSENHHYKEEYMLLISNLLGNYLIKMFEHNSLDDFSRWIQEHEGKLECSFSLYQYLTEVYNKICIQLATLKSMVSMERSILVNEIKKTLQLVQFCISSSSFCYICLNSFKKVDTIYEAILFSCGHLYHKDCIDPVNGQNFCYFCVSNSQYKSMIHNQNLNLVELLKQYREKKAQMRKPGAEIQVKQKETLISLEQKRKNRLKLFDKMVTSIETQAQIIDLKMVIEEYYKGQTQK